jgi:pimeloyl-ACP methyl ester carboxylesterase
MGRHVRAGSFDIWTEQVGSGPDVLLIGGAGDTVESWSFQLDGLADRYRLTAFDNRGAGRTAMPDGPVTVATMADDAAAVLDGVGIASAHVAGFSGGSITAQELALRRPDLVRSLVLQGTWARPDSYLRTWLRFAGWLAAAAPEERGFLEGFFLDVYTPRAHDDGTVAAFIEDVLAFPHKQSAEDLQRYLDALVDHDTTDRLPQVTAPTLVLAGGVDLVGRPELGRVVADAIPEARFEVWETEAHQPFQEVPDRWNARVDTFWRDVEARSATPVPRAATDDRPSPPAHRRRPGAGEGSAHPGREPAEQVAGHLVAVGPVEHLVPGVRGDPQLHRQATFAQQVGQRGDLGGVGPAHRVALAGEQQHRQPRGQAGHALGARRPGHQGEHPGAVAVRGRDVVAAQRVGQVGVDLRRIAAEPVVRRAGGLEGRIEAAKGVHRLAPHAAGDGRLELRHRRGQLRRDADRPGQHQAGQGRAVPLGGGQHDH